MRTISQKSTVNLEGVLTYCDVVVVIATRAVAFGFAKHQKFMRAFATTVASGSLKK